MSRPDKNYKSYANLSKRYIFEDETILANPTVHADAWKFSNCHDVTATGKAVFGGYEDCVDINRGSDLSIIADWFPEQSKQLATIKGGASDVHLSGVVHGHAKGFDVETDNYSDQEVWKKTRKIRISLVSEDGSPITVRPFWHVPEFLNAGEQEYKVCHWYRYWAMPLYCIYKAVLKKLKKS
jgi:hypothetical protein